MYRVKTKKYVAKNLVTELPVYIEITTKMVFPVILSKLGLHNNTHTHTHNINGHQPRSHNSLLLIIQCATTYVCPSAG